MTTYFQKASRIKELSTIIFALIIMMFFSSQIVFAEGENVCAIGSEEYGSLEDAIEAAESGDTITLLSNINRESSVNISGKTITLDGSGFTIKASQQGFSLMTIGESSVVTLRNITFDGNQNNSPIISINKSNLVIEDGAIIENGTSTDGYLAGGLVNRGGGTVTMNGGYIRNNSGAGSGGVYNVSSTFTMNGGVISGNSVSREDRGGGGIHNMSGRIVLNGGTITENTSGGAGGGVYIEWGNIVVNNCTITNNTAAWGGGILMSYPNYSYIYDATITGNHANGSGGGVYVAGSDWYGGHHLWIYGGTITENTAVDYAGGIYTGSGANWDGVYLVIDPQKNPDGPRLHNNSAGKAGDDLYCPKNSGTHLSFIDMDKYGLTLNEDGCGYPITRWFNDDVNNRYNAHDLSKPLHVVEVTERTNGGYGGNLSFQGLKAAHHILSVTYKDGVDEEAFPNQVIPNNHINQDTPAFDGIPTREGFAFIGWTPEVAEKVTEDAVYTAQWKEAIKVTVEKIWEDEDNKYDLRPESLEIVLNGDDGSSVTAVLDGTVDDEPSTTEPVGYEIEPWVVSFINIPKLDEEDNIIEYTTEENNVPEYYEVEVTGDIEEGFIITNTCTYEPPQIYEITYDLNGGEYKGSKENIIEEYESGTEIDIHEAPARDGYEFLYWEGSKYHPGDKYTVTENHTFTAQWKEVKSPDDPEDPYTPSDPDDPEDPDTPSDPSDPDTPAEPDKPSEPSRPANPEKTSSPGRPVPSGDNENAGLWIGLATLSLFGIAVDVVLRRRHS